MTESAQTQPPRGRLLAVNPVDPASREFVLLKAEVSIGSEESNDLVIRDSTVSRRHAVVRYRAGRCELSDLGSTNGTFVNNRRVSQPVVLEKGDEVRFGGARFVFSEQAATSHRRAGGGRRQRAKRKRRFSFRTALELTVIAFVVGFGATQYLAYLNYRRTETGPLTKAAPSPVAQTAPSEAPKAAPPEAAKAAPSEAPRAMASEIARSTPRPTVMAVSEEIPSWLRRVNYWRAMARLPQVAEDAALSDGDFKHARYLVENYGASVRNRADLGASMHQEETLRPWYTPEGLTAAKNSDVHYGCGRWDVIDEIDGWMTAPFHRLPIIDPGLGRVGYGYYEKDGCWAAALDIHPPDSGSGKRLKPLSQPLEFPPDGAVIGVGGFRQKEWPAPLTSCPGYTEPAGLPITLELGRWIDTQLSAHSLTRDGQPIEHCAFDASIYANPDAADQDTGRMVLKDFGTVVLIPRAPLTPGAPYKVSITVNGQAYNWSFSVQ